MTTRNWLIALALFALALALRLGDLGTFLTIDEPRWIEWSANFSGGLLSPDYACSSHANKKETVHGLRCTIRIYQPGVTTMWLGSLGLQLYYWQHIAPTGVDLLTFLSQPPTFTPELIRDVRLPFVIVNAAFCALLYLLLSRLISPHLSLITALLITLSPVHAALSRVAHHDALTTTCLVLALLLIIGYRLHEWGWRWFVLSAILTGLAILSKPMGWIMPIYLVAFNAWLIWQRREWRYMQQLTKETVIWLMLVLLTIWLLFPALWAIPREVIYTMLVENSNIANEGHSQFFLGEVSDNPGVWFYPINWFWQLTTVELLGLLGGLLILRHKPRPQPVHVAFILFIILYTLLVIYSPKKQARYLLPAIPIITVFIALGLAKLSRLIWQSPPKPVLYGFILLLQLGSLWQHYPYYFTYYNDWLGGTQLAPQYITVGWGEGLEQAAAYLNQQPQAKSLHVASWYSDIFQAYSISQPAEFNDDGRGQLSADYVVFYINQIQRQKPYPGLIDYFRQQPPVFTFDAPTLFGPPLHWVEVYPAPAATPIKGAPKIEGVAQLLAYKLHNPHPSPLPVGEGKNKENPPSPEEGSQSEQNLPLPVGEGRGEGVVTFTLYLRVLGPLAPDTTLSLIGRDAANQPQGNWRFRNTIGEWQMGHIVEWQGQIILPRPPYKLSVSYQFNDGKIIKELELKH